MRKTYIAVILVLVVFSGWPFTAQAGGVFPAATRIGIAESLLVTEFNLQRNDSRRRRKRIRQRRPWKRSTISEGKKISTGMGGVQPGPWGGEHIALTVTQMGASFEIDCAHGTIDEALKLDGNGRFSATGVYVRERGGPDREGQRPDSNPARFTGWTDGQRMTLTITLSDTGQTIMEFNLVRNKEPQMTKCL